MWGGRPCVGDARCADCWYRLWVNAEKCADADAVGKSSGKGPEAPFSVNKTSEDERYNDLGTYAENMKIPEETESQCELIMADNKILMCVLLETEGR